MQTFKQFLITEKDYNSPEKLDYDGIPDPLSLHQRIERKFIMQRNRPKILLGKRRESRILASDKRLETRAERRSRDTVERRVKPRKTRDEMSYSQRSDLERQVNKPNFLRLMKMIKPIQYRNARSDDRARK